MRNLTAAPCLAVALLMGGIAISWGADFQKGLEAAERGDYATALREWTPLAKQGDADAQINLGLIYDKGHGVQQDYKAAAKWYRLAAEQEDADAQNNLGVRYSKGQGVTQDHKTAVKWFRLAAEQGDAKAQNNLGVMYDHGQGVLQDNVLAYMWDPTISSGSLMRSLMALTCRQQGSDGFRRKRLAVRGTTRRIC
jgi:uncharacterized protein